MNKKLLLSIIILSSGLFCGCLSSTVPKKEDSMKLVGTEEIKPASPVIDFTFEELVENTDNLLNSVLDSYQIMTEAAQQSDAPKKGIKAADKVQKEYAERLAELKDTDLSGYSPEELYSLSEELSDIITAIREARDLLNGIS